VEDILRKDVVAAIFDKQPIFSLGPKNDRLPDYTAQHDEALRESVHAQVCSSLARGPSICKFYKASAKSFLKIGQHDEAFREEYMLRCVGLADM
jgi:hypothetical protein